MSTMEEAMLDLVAEQLGLDRTAVTLDSTLESLGVDSLDSVDLILATRASTMFTFRMRRARNSIPPGR